MENIYLEIKNKLIEHHANINFYEVDLIKGIIKIKLSNSFTKRYGLEENKIVINIDQFKNYVHEDDIEEIEKISQQLFNGEVNAHISFSCKIKYPKVKRYCYFKNVIEKVSKTLFFGVQIDITELKDTELKLKETKENYEVIVNNSTDLIVKYNLQGEIIYASPSYCRMFEIDEKAVINKRFSDFDKYLKVNDNKWYQDVLKPPYISHNLICINRNNQDLWLSWINNAVIINDKIEYIISVGHDVTKIIEINKKLEYQLNHDVLTGLLNRRAIYNEFEKYSNQTKIVCFFIDVNNFKQINDFYGHKTGDAILKKIGKMLKRFEYYGCIVGRIAGDEFIVLLPNIKELDCIKTSLLNELNRKININQSYIYITCSIGYAIYPDDASDFETLISYSDLAMYEVKHSLIYSKCQRFNVKMFEKLKEHIKLSNDLREYIKNDGIDVVYQEVVDCVSLDVKYLEVLARWKHQEFGYITPETFFNIAEQTGIVEELDYYLIDKAFKQFKRIKQMDKYKNSILSINVMPTTFLNPNFPKRLLEIIDCYGLACDNICIEINEKTFTKSIYDCNNQIIELKKYNVLIALNDFASKYSSLTILDDLDFDIIKTDRYFIKNVEDKPVVQVILKMLKEISLLTNKKIIIKGVETKAQKDFIQQLGFTLFQGFYYSKPKVI